MRWFQTSLIVLSSNATHEAQCIVHTGAFWQDFLKSIFGGRFKIWNTRRFIQPYKPGAFWQDFSFAFENWYATAYLVKIVCKLKNNYGWIFLWNQLTQLTQTVSAESSWGNNHCFVHFCHFILSEEKFILSWKNCLLLS